MHFCPKCGAILVQKKTKFCCPKCSYCTTEKIRIVSSEKIGKGTKIGVLHPKETDVWPTVAETCPKCGNGKAYTFSAQTRAGDEAETRFFRCTKCGYTWRDYS